MIAREYYSLNQAAERLSAFHKSPVTPKDVLHLGATGRLMVSISLEKALGGWLEETLAKQRIGIDERDYDVLSHYHQELQSLREERRRNILEHYHHMHDIQERLDKECLHADQGLRFAHAKAFLDLFGPFVELAESDLRKMEFTEAFTLNACDSVKVEWIVDSLDPIGFDQHGEEYARLCKLPIALAVDMHQILITDHALTHYERRLPRQATSTRETEKSKRISDVKLQIALGAFCLYLSKKDAAYRSGDKPNFERIAGALQNTLTEDARIAEGLTNLKRGLADAYKKMERERPKQI